MLRNLGESYDDAAQVLEATWDEEEETKKEVSKQLKKIYDKRRKRRTFEKNWKSYAKNTKLGSQKKITDFGLQMEKCFVLPSNLPRNKRTIKLFSW